jgi:hypothetical protein
MWGYESDYMIEESLRDGDLVFWAVDPLSIHVHEAIARFLFRRLKGDYDAWDFCGIARKDGNRMLVLGPNRDAVIYSDLVADYRTRSLAIRRLVDTSRDQETTERLKENIKPCGTSESIEIGARGFLENSMRVLLKKLYSEPETRYHSRLASVLRPEFRHFPLDVLGHPSASELIEVSDIFMNPLVNPHNETSYSPPFYVRRFDNEYYNHNSTKNVVVDWELLTQRDMKNRLVSEHNRKVG